MNTRTHINQMRTDSYPAIGVSTRGLSSMKSSSYEWSLYFFSTADWGWTNTSAANLAKAAVKSALGLTVLNFKLGCTPTETDPKESFCLNTISYKKLAMHHLKMKKKLYNNILEVALMRQLHWAKYPEERD